MSTFNQGQWVEEIDSGRVGEVTEVLDDETVTVCWNDDGSSNDMEVDELQRFRP